MTGFLNLNLLRAHAAPRDRWPDRGPAAFTRPRLVAQWACTPEGRRVCRWQTDDRTEPVPPTPAGFCGRAV
jgi:hypothetical protein